MIVLKELFFDSIVSYINKYKSNPTKDALLIELQEKNNLGKEYDIVVELIEEIDSTQTDVDSAWLIDNTEKFCQNKAIHNSIMESIEILNGNTKKDKGSIPTLLTEALSVSFDSHIGHDYIEDADDRFDFYNRKEEKIPFDIEMLNKITEGGLATKTLNVMMASPGAGKTLAMCHMAAGYLTDGYNVLYITLEMAEERISERIDANLMNVSISDLKNLPKAMYDKKIANIQNKTTGKLIVKEYPTVQAGAGTFQASGQGAWNET